jgi:hypothetical protein
MIVQQPLILLHTKQTLLLPSNPNLLYPYTKINTIQDVSFGLRERDLYWASKYSNLIFERFIGVFRNRISKHMQFLAEYSEAPINAPLTPNSMLCE